MITASADELEWQFQQRVTDLAEAHGWEWHHQRSSIGSRKGWPDLALWRPACFGQPGRFLLRELKRDGEQPRRRSKWRYWTVLNAAGADARVVASVALAGDRGDAGRGCY